MLCKVVAREHALDILGKAFTFDQALGLGTVQRKGDQLSPCSDERVG